MKKITKILIAMAVLAYACVPLFSASAKVTYVKGKVEVNRNDSWIQLNVGDEVSETEMLSTGFQSEARLNYNGSVMALAALTRITLSQLRTSGKKDYVDVYVDTGAVRSKVTHVDRDPPDYKTRTAVAVASVRGTDYVTFADSKIIVNGGAVAVGLNLEGKKSYAPEKEENASSEEITENKEDSIENPDAGVSDSREQDSGDDRDSKEKGKPNEVADVGPAKATTPAAEINENVDFGTIVVAASQTTNFSAETSIPEKPFDAARKQAFSGNSTVKTAADDRDSVPQAKPEEKRGSLSVIISIAQ